MIPVIWYLFLQLFGSNKYSLELINVLNSDCAEFDSISIIFSTDSVPLSSRAYFDRVAFRAESKKIQMTRDTSGFFRCIQNTDDLILVDEEGVWGSYTLNREGVDRLLTELDILILQKSYGKGTSR